MGKFDDISGKIFGFYTVMERVYKSNKKITYWLCKCKCGKENIVEASKLKNGKTKSCGCYQSAKIRREEIFNKSYKILENGCWEWQKNRDRNGYSEMGRWNNDIPRKGHRYSYEKYKGKIPKDLCVCHICDNRGCVNPDHLFLGTHQENHEDKIRKNRQMKGEKCHKSKLNQDQVKTIIGLYKSGKYTQRQLASIYMVNQYAIWAIVNRKSWKHLKF